MNDHNLDDLIIDDIEPKNSKTKSFLTIIALLIVVLIVAIILTKIILKNPDSARLALEENSTELISPELTLQSVTKTPTKKEEPKAPVVVVEPKVIKPTVKTIIESKKVEKAVQPTVKITQEFSQDPSINIQKEAERKALEAKRLANEKAQKAEQAKKDLQTAKTTTGYYIQVGSFAQTPSTRFLSIIKNSGFDYKITPASSTGTKKLLIGPYASRAEADTALVRVKDRINKSAFVIKK